MSMLPSLLLGGDTTHVYLKGRLHILSTLICVAGVLQEFGVGWRALCTSYISLNSKQYSFPESSQTFHFVSSK